VLVLLLAAGTTYALSQTLILPAMPALVRTLDASPLAVSWLLTAYLVSASVATPVIGRMGDLLGRGRVLTWTMAVFCAGSVLCALGGSLAALVAGRVLQGVAGGVFPLAYGIIRDTWPAATRMRAIGMLSVSLGVGAALGPGVAGVIVDHAGPTAIFWVGMAGAVPALAAFRLVADVPDRAPVPVDWAGGALLAGWLTALLVLMTQGQELGWTSPPALGLALAGVGLLAGWLRVEARRRAPLVDLSLLRGRTIALTNVAALCVGCGIFMAYVPLAPMAQAPASTGYGLGLSVAAAGALLIPHGAVQILVGPWAGSLCARIGSRATLLLGAALNTSTMVAVTAVHGSAAALLVAGGVLGLGQALALTAMANLIVAAAPQADVGVATGMNAVMRTVGMALGSALSAAILAGATAPGGAYASEHGYVVAFAVAACATAGAVASAAALPRRPATPEAQPAAGTGTRVRSGSTSRPMRSVLRSSRSMPTPRVPT
jgi:MFS family permease